MDCKLRCRRGHHHYIFGTGSDGGGFNEDGFVYRRNNHFALEFEELGFGGILGELFGQVASERTESGILIDGMAGSDVGDGGHAGIEAYSPYAVVRAVAAISASTAPTPLPSSSTPK